MKHYTFGMGVCQKYNRKTHKYDRKVHNIQNVKKVAKIFDCFKGI